MMPHPRLTLCRPPAPKPAIPAERTPINKLLHQLRAIDTVMQSINEAAGRIAIAGDLASQLYNKLEHRSELALGIWNDVNARKIYRCSGVDQRCERYTTNERGVCNACKGG